MAWLIDAVTDKVLINSGWSGTAFTVVMWVKRTSATSNSHGNNPFRAWSAASAGGSTVAGIDVQGSSRTTVVAYDSAFTQTVGGDIRADAGWHPIAVVVNGTAWALFYGNDPAALTKVTATRATGATVGSWTLSDATPDWFDGSISNVKLFSRALSDAEVAAELATPAQVSATNLVFRGTLNTTSTTPETGTTMTAGGTGVTAVPGPALVVTSTTTATTAAAIAVPPPLAAYGFTGAGTTVTDDSGNGHDWSLSGGATLTASGKTGQGLTTDGTGVTSTVASPAFGQTSSRTVMLWMINPANVTQWVLRWNVVSIGSGSWGILLLNTQVVAQARNAGGLQRAAATRPTDGLWHHYAATYDGTNVRFYLDGTLTDTQALTAPLRTDADTIDVGEWTDTTTVVDDLRLYDSALSAAQIAYLSGIPVGSGALSATATSTTTTAVTAAARAAGTASSTTSTAVTAAAVVTGAATSSTTTATSAAARAAGAASSTTTTAVTAAARGAGTATSTTTTATTAAASNTGSTAVATSTTTTATSAAARAAGTASSTTTTTVTAAARGAGRVLSSTNTQTTAAAVDLTFHQPPGPYRAGTPVLTPGWRATSPTRAPVLAGGWRAGTPVVA